MCEAIRRFHEVEMDLSQRDTDTLHGFAVSRGEAVAGRISDVATRPGESSPASVSTVSVLRSAVRGFRHHGLQFVFPSGGQSRVQRIDNALFSVHEFGFAPPLVRYTSARTVSGWAQRALQQCWPSDIRSQTNTHTITETYEAKASYAPFESRASTLLLTGAFGFSDSWERDVFGLTYRDHLRMVSLTADYRLQDSIGGWNYLSVTGRQGLNIFGASSKQDLDISRPGASPNSRFSAFPFGACNSCPARGR